MDKDIRWIYQVKSFGMKPPPKPYSCNINTRELNYVYRKPSTKAFILQQPFVAGAQIRVRVCRSCGYPTGVLTGMLTGRGQEPARCLVCGAEVSEKQSEKREGIPVPGHCQRDGCGNLIYFPSECGVRGDWEHKTVDQMNAYYCWDALWWCPHCQDYAIYWWPQWTEDDLKKYLNKVIIDLETHARNIMRHYRVVPLSKLKEMVMDWIRLNQIQMRFDDCDLLFGALDKIDHLWWKGQREWIEPPERHAVIVTKIDSKHKMIELSPPLPERMAVDDIVGEKMSDDEMALVHKYCTINIEDKPDPLSEEHLKAILELMGPLGAGVHAEISKKEMSEFWRFLACKYGDDPRTIDQILIDGALDILNQPSKLLKRFGKKKGDDVMACDTLPVGIVKLYPDDTAKANLVYRWFGDELQRSPVLYTIIAATETQDALAAEAQRLQDELDKADEK